MASDNALSKSIRPLTLLILMFFELLIIIAEMLGRTVSDAVVIQVGSLLGGAVGFYFFSKQRERVAEKNAKANVQIKQTELKIQERKAKHEIKQERKDARAERRSARRDAGTSG